MRGASFRERLDYHFEVPAMVSCGGGGARHGNGDPRWRSVQVGEKFRVSGKPTKAVSRDAAYYKRNYNLRFTVRNVGDDTIVERIG